MFADTGLNYAWHGQVLPGNLWTTWLVAQYRRIGVGTERGTVYLTPPKGNQVVTHVAKAYLCVAEIHILSQRCVASKGGTHCWRRHPGHSHPQ